MKHLQTLDSYLDECGHLSLVVDALDRFAPQVKKDAGKLFDEFSKYRMVRNTVTSRSGQVDHKKTQVEIHAELLIVGREEQFNQTLLHETAHVIVALLFPESVHPLRIQRSKLHSKQVSDSSVPTASGFESSFFQSTVGLSFPPGSTVALRHLTGSTDDTEYVVVGYLVDAN